MDRNEQPINSYDQLRKKIKLVTDVLRKIENTSDIPGSFVDEGFEDFIRENFPALVAKREHWSEFITYGNPISFYQSFLEIVDIMENFKKRVGDHDAVDEVYNAVDSLIKQITTFKYIEGGIFGPMADEDYLAEMASLTGLFIAQMLYTLSSNATAKELEYFRDLPKDIIRIITDFREGGSREPDLDEKYMPELERGLKRDEEEMPLKPLKARTIYVFKRAMQFLS